MTLSSINIKIGEAIKHFRKMKNLTQKDLATQLNITHQQVQKYESGETIITIDKAYQISSILSISILDLLKYAEPELRNQIDTLGSNEENYPYLVMISNSLKNVHSVKEKRKIVDCIKALSA